MLLNEKRVLRLEVRTVMESEVVLIETDVEAPPTAKSDLPILPIESSIVTQERLRSSSKKHGWLVPAKFKQPHTSEVWNHFDYFEARIGSGLSESDRVGYVVRCKYEGCHRELAFNSSSTHGMLGHVQSHHSDKIKYSNADEKKIPAVTRHDGPPFKQMRLENENFTGKQNSLKLEGKKKKAIDECVFKHVVQEGLPFSIAQKKSFRDIFKAAGLDYIPPEEHAIGGKMLNEAFSILKAKRLNFLKTVSNLSVTVDEWSLPSQRRSFVVLTGHGWTESFDRFEVTLSAIDFSGVEHNAANTREYITRGIESCGLSMEQVICMLADGAPVMKKTISDAGFKRIHCLAHVINLILEAAVKCTDLSPVIEAARNNIRSITCSFKLQRLLSEAHTTLGTTANELVQDVVTRWDSTLAMLRSIIENVNAVNFVAEQLNKDGKNGAALTVFGQPQIRVIKDVIKFLENFEQITSIASSSAESCSSYLPIATALKLSVKALVENESVGKWMKRMVKAASDAIERLMFSGRNNVTKEKIFRYSSFMDPRYCYAAELLTSNEWRVIQAEISQEVALLVAKPTTNFGDHQAESVHDETVVIINTAPVGALDLLQRIGTGDESFLDLHKPNPEAVRRAQVEMKTYLSMLKNYRATPNSTQTETMAKFWYENRNLLPFLYRIAQKYLSPPLGPVQVERLFSGLTSLLSNKSRNGLEDEKVAELILLRDYFRSGDAYLHTRNSDNEDTEIESDIVDVDNDTCVGTNSCGSDVKSEPESSFIDSIE